MDNLKCKIRTGNETTSEIVKSRLLDYNTKFIPADGPNTSISVHLVLQDQSGTIQGGLETTIFPLRARCYLNILWVSEELRGLGYGKKLLIALEARTQKENCKVILLDTASFQAPKFYENMGYCRYGQIDDYPQKNVSIFYFYKRLRA